MAARGGDGRRYPWGTTPLAWDKKREPRRIDPVMSSPHDVSPFGAYDMAGDAMEWTKDRFDPRHFRHPPAVDPTGPSRPGSSQRTVKGGSKGWVVTKREAIRRDSRLPCLGFRCVLQADGPQNAPGANPSQRDPVLNAVL